MSIPSIRLILTLLAVPLVAGSVLFGHWVAAPTPLVGALWSAGALSLVYVAYSGWVCQPLVLLGSLLGFVLIVPYGQSLFPYLGFIGGLLLLQTALGVAFLNVLQRSYKGLWDIHAVRVILIGGMSMAIGPLIVLILPQSWLPVVLHSITHEILLKWAALGVLSLAAWTPIFHLLSLPNIKHYRRFLAIAPVIVLWLLSSTVYRMEIEREHAIRQELFQEMAADMAMNLSQKMAVYEEILYSLKYFYDGSEEVDASEFSTFSGRFHKRHPEIRALSWARHVVDNDENLPAWRNGHSFIQEDERQHRFIVEFVESANRASQAIGFDLSSEADRRDAIIRTVKTGNIALTEPIDLITTKERGFLMMAPVFKQHSQNSSQSTHWDMVEGVVIGVFSIKGLLQDLLAKREGQHIYVTVKDANLEGENGFIFSNRPNGDSVDLQWRYVMPVGGRNWELLFTADALFLSASHNLSVWLYLAGLLLCSGIGLFQLIIMGRTSLVEELVEIRTQELSDKQKDLEKEKHKAEKLNESKSSFLASLSHEIRVPLSGITGAVGLMESSTLSADQKKSIRIINSGIHNIIALLNDILDITRIESGRLELASEVFNLPDLCHDVVSMTDVQVSDAISVELVLAPGVPRMVGGDSLRLRQILSNLMNNAAKFTQKGHITLEVKFEKVEKNLIHLCFVVEDTGIGVPEDKQQTIFEKFRQASVDHAKIHGGAGMGLAICYELTKLMDGYIDLESEVGKGSRFLVHLPLLLCEDKEIQEATQPLELDAVKGVRILVAEDNPINQKVMAAFLERYNVKVTIVNNGLAALEQAKKHHFDLIAMDVQMPEMTGVEAARNMRDAGVSVPIIAITGNAAVEDRNLGIASGMNDYLLKPIRQSDIERMLQKWVVAQKQN